MIHHILSRGHHILSRIISILVSFFSKTTTVAFDSGISVSYSIDKDRIGEGGFSYIYAAHDCKYPSRKYALKRILCPDKEIVIGCENEAKVHFTLGNNNSNLLPLKALKFDSSGPQTVCYMLLPLVTGGSLRDEISKRMLLKENALESERHPFTEKQLLVIFKGILRGAMAMHDVGLAHCDIKLENVLLDKTADKDNYTSGGLGTPILIDYGSARSLVIKLSCRRTVLNLTEEAARNSTVSYRAPELFDGGCRHGTDEPDIDGKIDVWSCGCLLYGMMYGASPFEMEFRNGSPRIVECTYLRVLGGKIPCLPNDSEVGRRFSRKLMDLVRWIVNIDRVNRPDLEAVLRRVEDMENFVGSPSRGGVLELV